MKATKKQIAEVTAKAIEMGFSSELALQTLSNCSASIYKAIGAQGVVESSMRAIGSHFVDTAKLAQKANKMGVYVDELLTPEQRMANFL